MPCVMSRLFFGHLREYNASCGGTRRNPIIKEEEEEAVGLCLYIYAKEKHSSMEVAQKKARAPKTTNKQLDFLITYMENHTAFATGKLLGARGKPVHDLQWQQLTEQLNSLDGPSKGTEGWKKLWCDQRNQARGRAAKAKTAQRMTGNIGTPIQLKDFDLRILSIFGGESSVGLPIMEVGLGQQPEDIIDPTSVLGLTSNNVFKENVIAEKENETSATEQSIDKENPISFTLCQDDTLLSTFDNEETYQFHTSNIDRIPLQPILPSSNKQHNVPNMSTQLTAVSKKPLTANASSVTKHSITGKRPRTSSVEETQQYTQPCSSKQHNAPINMSTQLTTASKESLTANAFSITKCNRKRLRTSSVEETRQYITNTLDNQNESLQALVVTLNRIASATEQQTELLKTLIETLKVLFTNM